MQKKKLLAGVIGGGLIFGIFAAIGVCTPADSIGSWLRYALVASGIVFFLMVALYILLAWQVK
jgi:hypothetical protein